MQSAHLINAVANGLKQILNLILQDFSLAFLSFQSADSLLQSFLFDFRQAFSVLLKIEVRQILLLMSQGKLVAYVSSHGSVVESFIQDSLY
jgi:hypothetical protein